MAGDAPGRVSDAVIAELRGRERDRLIELPKAPGLKPGDHVRIIAGPFSEQLTLYEGQAPRGLASGAVHVFQDRQSQSDCHHRG